jgi:hypothetical protein
MIGLLRFVLAVLALPFKSKIGLEAENAVLRHQLTVLRRRLQGRVRLTCSLIATAKLNKVEPYAWLRDVLQRMTGGHPASRLDELLPWNWQPISVKI